MKQRRIVKNAPESTKRQTSKASNPSRSSHNPHFACLHPAPATHPHFAAPCYVPAGRSRRCGAAQESKKGGSPVEIGEVMGVAPGCIHLSLDDFLRLTPEEFDDIYKAYSDDREAVYRSGWEQTRILAAIVIAPHVKRPPSPQKLIPLPWDKTKRRTMSDADTITREESKARFECLAKR